LIFLSPICLTVACASSGWSSICILMALSVPSVGVLIAVGSAPKATMMPIAVALARNTIQGILAEAIPADQTIVYSDEYRSYHGITHQHATVNHGQHEWARDDDGDGVREVHCNSCEGSGAGLRTFLRPFRGVHKAYLHSYVATYEALVNAKHVSPSLICRMCWPPKQPPHAYWT
jgi:transposase